MEENVLNYAASESEGFHMHKWSTLILKTRVEIQTWGTSVPQKRLSSKIIFQKFWNGFRNNDLTSFGTNCQTLLLFVSHFFCTISAEYGKHRLSDIPAQSQKELKILPKVPIPLPLMKTNPPYHLPELVYAFQPFRAENKHLIYKMNCLPNSPAHL